MPDTRTAKHSRVLVLCFDGTSDQYGLQNSNVVRFHAMLRKDREGEQLTYYQPGIGTSMFPSFWSPLVMTTAKLADEAFAWCLKAHVIAGYRYLMDHYQSGDKICIFGFSRGAYTARALAAMLTKVGLLARNNAELIPLVWKLYSKTDATSLAQAENFKRAFAQHVEMNFLGVWDTVASTGVLWSKILPFATSKDKIKTVRHALALDERRVRFEPAFWHVQDAALPKAAKGSTKKSKIRLLFARLCCQSSEDIEAGEDPQEKRAEEGPDSKESDTPAYDVKEVWFAGGHSDVGGWTENDRIGRSPDEAKGSLADITLRWMVREVIASNCGIQFDTAAMERFRVLPFPPADQSKATPPVAANVATSSPQAKGSDEQPQAQGSIEQPQPSKQDEASDTSDAERPIHDELSRRRLWWMLEVLPLVFTWQDKRGKRYRKWMPHMGRGRYKDHKDALLFHETVRIRMQSDKTDYRPRLKYTSGTEEYVW